MEERRGSESYGISVQTKWRPWIFTSKIRTVYRQHISEVKKLKYFKISEWFGSKILNKIKGNGYRKKKKFIEKKNGKMLVICAEKDIRSEKASGR